MKITWDKRPVTSEQKNLAEYLVNHSDIIVDLVKPSMKQKFFSASITPKPFETGFYTFELKKDPPSDSFLVFVWKGIRTGDAVPLLYGYVDNKNFKSEPEEKRGLSYKEE